MLDRTMMADSRSSAIVLLRRRRQLDSGLATLDAWCMTTAGLVVPWATLILALAYEVTERPKLGSHSQPQIKLK